MLIQPPRSNADNVRPDGIEHLPVVGKAAFSTRSFDCLSAAFGIRVGHRDNAASRNLEPRPIDEVAVVAATSMANYRDAILPLHGYILVLSIVRSA